MMDVDSEQEAARAMMQLYLSPMTPSLVPSLGLQAAVPELNLEKLAETAPKQNRRKSHSIDTLISALTKDSDINYQSHLHKRRNSVNKASRRHIDTPVEILPRLRSHARTRRRNSVANAYTRKIRAGSIDSDAIHSEPGERNQYEMVCISSNRKVGIYSPEERKELIRSFLKKRKKRVWQKKIKYRVRKTFADSRLRVKGRFVSKEAEAQLRECLVLAA